MNNLNSIIVEGTVVREPESSETTAGSLVCRFTIDSTRFYKHDGENTKEVSFFNVETWSKLAQQCVSVLHAGRGVRIVGRLKQDRWTDLNGDQRSRIYIVAEHVEFKHVFKNKEIKS